MCGRYTLTADLKKVADRFGAPMPEGEGISKKSEGKSDRGEGSEGEYEVWRPRYNIAPTQAVIVVGDDGKRYLKPMRWGLIPSWTKDPSIGNRMINARAETLAEKPAFRNALKKRRCIIPADGFYEWQKLGKVKQPLRIVLKSREPFGFAGLWEHWKSPDGEEILSCTIITTAANELLKDVHERMPVILTRDAEAAWLDPKTQDTGALLALLKQYPAEEMEFYPVSRDVNSPAVDVPGNIEPIKAGSTP
jgi:putative SOS response-associated peptidase YedK